MTPELTFAEADRLRGHPFLPPDRLRKQVPALYWHEPLDLRLDEYIVRLHWFSPSADWWVCEADWDDRIVWGYARIDGLGPGEWGYASLDELALLYYEMPVRGPEGTRWVCRGFVERDLYWTPAPWGEVAAGADL